MRQLSQLEKRLLRIIAVQQQMQATGTVGDYAKTIETFSNQLRIFKEQVIELGSTWGKIFLVKLKPVLVYLNAIILSSSVSFNNNFSNVCLSTSERYAHSNNVPSKSIPEYLLSFLQHSFT